MVDQQLYRAQGGLERTALALLAEYRARAHYVGKLFYPGYVISGIVAHRVRPPHFEHRMSARYLVRHGALLMGLKRSAMSAEHMLAQASAGRRGPGLTYVVAPAGLPCTVVQHYCYLRGTDRIAA